MGNSILSNYRNLTSDIMGIHHGINPPLYPANINDLVEYVNFVSNDRMASTVSY